MMYNKDEKSTDEFFQERGISRGDVGTKRYPEPWIRRMVATLQSNSLLPFS